jgi:hypothetical protein
MFGGHIWLIVSAFVTETKVCARHYVLKRFDCSTAINYSLTLSLLQVWNSSSSWLKNQITQFPDSSKGKDLLKCTNFDVGKNYIKYGFP